MAQINLLKQSGGGHNLTGLGTKILIRLFLLVLAGLIGYYVWLFLDLSSQEKLLLAARTKMNLEKQAALSIKNRNELFTRQDQIKSLTGLVGKHLYWSQLLPKIAEVTLKTAGYKNLAISPDGSLTMSVNVPTLVDLAKYMQVFDLPEVTKNFSNVHIGGFSKVQSKDSSLIQFSVRMNYNPEILKYQPPKP